MQNVPFNLDDVTIDAELRGRPSRPPDYKAERDALIMLCQSMADPPPMILQKLVDTALHLCRAEIAGIRVLENYGAGEAMSQEALTGLDARRDGTARPDNPTRKGNTTPRGAEHLFPALKSVPPAGETLVIPFHAEGKPIGILWVVRHKEHRKFDCEDERNVRTLAQFASAAWRLWNARATAQAAAKFEYERASELATATQQLQIQGCERDMQRLIEELEISVTQKTAEVATANKALTRMLEDRKILEEQLRQAQKMESVGILAGELAHDVNNVLNIIQGHACAIMTQPANPRTIIEDAQLIQEAVDDVAALVQQLLMIARKTEVKFDRTDINALLRRLAKLLTGAFPNKIMISLELDPGVPNLQLDANQINQALLNLCINARDAMPDGGTLLLRTRSLSGAELGDRFRENESERYVRISVADTGSGMAEEIKSRVFEPFFTTKEPGKGTGLGLSVVYGIVGNQNGFIDVTSEPGRGSTFHIYLPVPKDQAASVETTIPQEEESMRQCQ
jgi:signal transduction histidine kinase